MVRTTTQTQVTLRLQLLTLEVHSMIDRTASEKRLHEIAEYCIPQRLLHSIHIYGMRGREGFMHLEITIDYDAQDQRVTLRGSGLSTDGADEYQIADDPSNSDGPIPSSRHHCPRVAKVISLFMAALRKRGLVVGWTVGFCDRHKELCERFHLLGGGPFTDHTAGSPATTAVHSLLPELSVATRSAPDVHPSVDASGSHAKSTPQDGPTGGNTTGPGDRKST